MRLWLHVCATLVGGILAHAAFVPLLERFFHAETATVQEAPQAVPSPPGAVSAVTATTEPWRTTTTTTTVVHAKWWAHGLLDVAGGFVSFLLSYFITTVKDRHSLNYRSLERAADRFLVLTKNIYEISEGGTRDQRMLEFASEFAAEDEPVKSFVSVGIETHSRLCSLLRQSRDSSVDAGSYYDQIRIASFLCSRGNQRFWAVSTDPTLVFHRENAHYYQALDAAADNYHRTHAKNKMYDGGPPYLCRIFLSEPENLDYSLDLYALDFLEMYRRHILWAEQRAAEPIRFLLGSPEDEIRKAGGKAGDLQDFMVVDDEFVYGRQGGYARHSPRLRTYTRASDIDRYSKTFARLYLAAKNVFQILDQKIGEAAGNEKRRRELENLKDLCSYIKQKAEIRPLYTARFDPSQRHGTAFFERICKLIGDSKGDVIAVDVADKKVSNFYRAWTQHKSYLKFREYGANAVRDGRIVMRLFILQHNVNPGDAAEIETFLMGFLKDGVAISFISATDASREFKNRPYSFDFELDFLLGGIPTEFISPAQGAARSADDLAEKDKFKDCASKFDAFGFELFGNEPFVEGMLEWERNLVDLEGMWRKLILFNRLWMAVPEAQKSRGINGADAEALKVEAARLKEELLKINLTIRE
jgi:hypothetical protein